MDAPRSLRRPVLQQAAAAASLDPQAVDACRRLLLPLRRADIERRGDLERTVRAYYECGASVSTTAQTLFLHRNSVRYRLDRVRALLGADIDDPQISATLLIAFAVDAAARSSEDEHGAAQRAQ
jgi:DNA-binding PucR family transcriptional regulator